MRIGWIGHGPLNYETKSRCGRLELCVLRELIEQGHEVHYFQLYGYEGIDKSLDGIIENRAFKARDYLADKFNDKVKEQLGDKWINIEGKKQRSIGTSLYMNRFEFFGEDNFPELDAVITRWCGNIDVIIPRCILACHYASQDIPFLVWDSDLAYTNIHLSIEPEYIEYDKIKSNMVFLAQIDDLKNYKREGFKNIETFHYPIDLSRDLRKPSEYPILDVVYVGHDYDRRQAFDRLLGDMPSDIKVGVYGSWKKDMIEKYPNIEFLGHIPPDDVPEAYRNSYCAIHFVTNKYAKQGNMTVRIAEATACGTILLADSEIVGIEKHVSKEFLVGNSNELAGTIRTIKNLPLGSREKLMVRQSALSFGTLKKLPQYKTKELLEIINKYRRSNVSI